MVSIGKSLPSYLRDRLRLADDSTTLVLWLRHFGCRFFQEAMLRLPPLKLQLEQLQVDLLCVVQGTEEETAAFWPLDDIKVLPDHLRESYREMGLERTSFRKIFFPVDDLKERRKEVTAMGCAMNRHGTRAKSSDVLQLPGLALIGSQGRVLWLHRSSHTGDLDLGESLPAQVARVMSEA